MTRFAYCVDFVIQHEAVFDKNGNVVCERDIHDPGGATCWGIDQRSHPEVDICALTREQAEWIYHDGEWTRCRCSDMPAGWDLAVFDTAVNLGMGWAVPAMQRTVGVKADGIIGPVTLQALNDAPPDRLEAYLELREAHYRALKPELVKQYLKGWLARVADLRGVLGDTSPDGTMAA